MSRMVVLALLLMIGFRNAAARARRERRVRGRLQSTAALACEGVAAKTTAALDLKRHCEERSDEAIHTFFPWDRWIASLRSQ
jgi:hypothetical protein